MRLGETQAGIDPRDWQRWCRELRQNLCAIAAQEQAMLGFFRSAGANPPRLCWPTRGWGSRPDGADLALLDAALAAVAAARNLDDCPSLWIDEAA